MNYIKEYYNYIQANPDKVNKKIKIIYKKLYEDTLKTEPYFFDEKKGSRPIEFIEKFCRNSKGKTAGKLIKLELFQKAFIQALYGFINTETKKRKYKKSNFFIARKNGKTTMSSGLAVYMVSKDGEGGAEVYSVATKRDQAKGTWDESVNMIKSSPFLNKHIDCRFYEIRHEKSKSKYKALASNSNGLDGLNSHFIICDEVHAWKDKKLLEVMETSTSAREQPIILETSTMGWTRENVFDDEYKYSSTVLKDIEEGRTTDETLLPIIYELDEAEEWKKEEAWYKANPGLGTIKSSEYLMQNVERAKKDSIYLTNLLCKDFNVRVNKSENWLEFDIVNNEETFDKDVFYDTYAVGGVDLSSTTDLTCATIMIIKSGKKYINQMYFIPEKLIEKRTEEDKIPYDIWKNNGLVRTCEGFKIDYKEVTKWFKEWKEKYKVTFLWIGYDPWNSKYWSDEMESEGFKMVEVRQGYKTLSNPTKELRADLLEKRLIYNNNPITKWCLLNTQVKIDENENIRPVKGKNSRERIDGVMSLLDAYVVINKELEYYNYLMERIEENGKG